MSAFSADYEIEKKLQLKILHCITFTMTQHAFSEVKMMFWRIIETHFLCVHSHMLKSQTSMRFFKCNSFLYSRSSLSGHSRINKADSSTYGRPDKTPFEL